MYKCVKLPVVLLSTWNLHAGSKQNIQWPAKPVIPFRWLGANMLFLSPCGKGYFQWHLQGQAMFQSLISRMFIGRRSESAPRLWELALVKGSCCLTDRPFWWHNLLFMGKPCPPQPLMPPERAFIALPLTFPYLLTWYSWQIQMLSS